MSGITGAPFLTLSTDGEGEESVSGWVGGWVGGRGLPPPPHLVIH